MRNKLYRINEVILFFAKAQKLRTYRSGLMPALDFIGACPRYNRGLPSIKSGNTIESD
jgi:hypothetical protein